MTDKERKLHEFDEEVLLGILNDLKRCLSHEQIRFIYQAQKRLRKELNEDRFPVFRLYRMSLMEELNTNYSSVTTREIAAKEGIKERTAYNIRKFFWHKKHLEK